MVTIQSNGNTFTNDPEAQELAKKQVGDGKEPNKFFLTLTNEVFEKENDEWVPKTLDGKPIKSVTLLFYSKQEAMNFIHEKIDVMDDDPETVKNLYLEDRLNGEVYWQYVETKMVRQFNLNIVK